MSQGTDRLEVVIGDSTFFVRRYEAFLGLELLGDLQQRFLGPLVTAINVQPGALEKEEKPPVVEGEPAKEEEPTAEGELSPAALRMMMQAFATVSASLDGRTLRQLAIRILDPEYVSVSISGGTDRKLNESARALSLHSPGDILMLCREVLVFNFSDFLVRLQNPTGPVGSLLARSPWGGSGRK